LIASIVDIRHVFKSFWRSVAKPRRRYQNGPAQHLSAVLQMWSFILK
jgi:hypothetical protein